MICVNNRDTVMKLSNSKQYPVDVRDNSRALTKLDEIRVPTDMWRKPSKYPDWHPVNLPNCCFNRHTGKPWKSLLGKVDVRYYGPGMEYTPDDLKGAIRDMGGDMVLVGDSVTRLWNGELKCYLGARHAPDADEEEDTFLPDMMEQFLKYSPEWRKLVDLNKFGKPSYFKTPAEAKDVPSQRVMYLPFTGRTSSGVEMNLALMEYLNNQYPLDFSRQRPFFVINIGLHYNRQDGLEEDYRIDMKTLILHCRKLGARCIFRETTPQYWDNPQKDGSYPGLENATGCFQKTKKFFGTLTNWRNDVMYSALKECESLGLKEGGLVEVMPLFKKLEGLNGRHVRRSEDCTHLACDANNWEPYHVSLTETLIGISNAKTAV